MPVKTMYDELGSLVREIGQVKQANAAGKVANTRNQNVLGKKADTPLSEPGHIDGETTHPVKSVDDGLQNSTEGSRSSENSADVKEMIPANVDETSEGMPDQNTRQLNIGTTQLPTGEDPSHETGSTKGDKDDPGTTHPANTEDGQKYGSYSGKPFSHLYKQAGVKADSIMAKIAVAMGLEKKQSVQQAQPAAPAQGQKQANSGCVPVVMQDKNRGKPAPVAPAAPAAPAVQQAPDYATVKRAIDEHVKQAVEQTIRDAITAADEVGSYLTNYYQTKQAQANAQKSSASQQAPRKRAADESAVAEGETEEPAAPVEEGGGEDLGGGAPADVMGGGGGDPAAAMGGGGEGGGGEQAAVEQLLMALEEQGIPPEVFFQKLLADLQGGGAGGDPAAAMGGGGGDPAAAMGGGAPVPGAEAALAGMGGGGGALPEEAKLAAMRQKQAAQQVDRALVKLASQAIVAKRRGTKYRGAKTADEARMRAEIKNCVADIMTR